MNVSTDMERRDNVNLFRRFLPYFKKYKWILILDLFCASLTTVCELVLPLIVRFITDTGANDISKLTVQLILSLGAFYMLLRVIDTAANYYMASIGHVMGARIRDRHEERSVLTPPEAVVFILRRDQGRTDNVQTAPATCSTSRNLRIIALKSSS